MSIDVQQRCALLVLVKVHTKTFRGGDPKTVTSVCGVYVVLRRHSVPVIGIQYL